MLKVLDPKFASTSHVSPPSLSHLVSKVPNLVKPEKVDELEDQWRSYRLTAKELPLQISTVSISQWYNLSSIKDGLKNPKSPLLSQCMVNLNCLPHSSACVERIFSQVINIKNKKTNSLKAITTADRILAKQSIKKNNCDCTKWKPSKALVQNVENGITYAMFEL